MKTILSFFTSIFLAGCSVVGASDVKTPSYKLLAADEELQIEVRRYDSLILASTPMVSKSENSDGRNGAFGKLFDYISGENTGEQKIKMTAPVIMDEKNNGTKIPMTAPVFMDEGTSEPMMSFVLPSKYTLNTAPQPTSGDVSLSELKDYTVAAIRFSGRMTDSTVQKHENTLREWIASNDYQIVGDMKRAGYNAPFTLPALRRNEVIFEVEK